MTKLRRIVARWLRNAAGRLDPITADRDFGRFCGAEKELSEANAKPNQWGIITSVPLRPSRDSWRRAYERSHNTQPAKIRNLARQIAEANARSVQNRGK